MHIKPYTIGVFIDSTATKSGIVNHRGKIIGKGSVLPTGMYLCAESFVQDLHKALLPVLEKVGHENIKGIGIVAPKSNNYTGSIDNAYKLPWKSVAPLTDIAEQVFNLSCMLTNNANAAAIGEMMYGAARDLKDFIVITLDSSVGCGIVANGELINGHYGFAGELGYVVVRKGRKHWSTGHDGLRWPTAYGSHKGSYEKKPAANISK